jgi:hypothetical protein
VIAPAWLIERLEDIILILKNKSVSPHEVADFLESTAERARVGEKDAYAAYRWKEMKAQLSVMRKAAGLNP